MKYKGHTIIILNNRYHVRDADAALVTVCGFRSQAKAKRWITARIAALAA